MFKVTKQAIVFIALLAMLTAPFSHQGDSIVASNSHHGGYTASTPDSLVQSEISGLQNCHNKETSEPYAEGEEKKLSYCSPTKYQTYSHEITYDDNKFRCYEIKSKINLLIAKKPIQTLHKFIVLLI